MEHLLINIQSLFIFVLVLGILVLVHEWGHFITAKRLGVDVERFAVGFGPTVYSRTHNGTLYMVNAIPLGGYVKMAGDERTQCTGRPDEFYSQPVGRRALVVFNGPFVNFIFAYLCLFVVFMIGYPDLSNKVGSIVEGYPAQAAGLQTGDRILSIDGAPIDHWTALQDAIIGSSDATLTFQVARDGKTMTLPIAPREETVKTIFGKYKAVRLVGIRPSEEIVSLKYSPGVALVKSGQELWRITWMTYKAIFSMLTGAMSAKENVTGPIGIFYIIRKAMEMGFSHLLFILGVISASLAIFNLLPIIPLDGGHLFLFGIEKLRGKALPPKIDEYIIKVGFSLIIFIALFVFYSDFSNYGWIDKVKGLFH